MWCSMPSDNGECNGVEGEAIFPSNLQNDEMVVQQQNLQKKITKPLQIDK